MGSAAQTSTQHPVGRDGRRPSRRLWPCACTRGERRRRRPRGPPRTASRTAARAASQPHWACPHGLCDAIVDPRPSTAAGLQSAVFNKKKPEGGGEEGGIDPEELRAAYAIPATGGAGQTIAVIEGFSYKNSRKRPRQIPLALRPAAVHRGERLPDDRQLRRRNAGQPRLHRMGTRGRARPRHGLGGVPRMPHHARERRRRNAGTRSAPRSNYAAAHGATEISNSYGLAEETCGSECAEAEADWNHPGIFVSVSSGDYGYDNEYVFGESPSFPAVAAHRRGGRRHGAEESRRRARLQGESLGRTLARARHRQRLQRDLAEARLAARTRAAPGA